MPDIYLKTKCLTQIGPGSPVALHFCVQSIIVSIGGTLAVTGLQGDSAWPLATFSSIMAVAVLVAQGWLHHQGRLRT